MNTLYKCPYNKAAKCDLLETCRGCEDFKNKYKLYRRNLDFIYKPPAYEIAIEVKIDDEKWRSWALLTKPKNLKYIIDRMFKSIAIEWNKKINSPGQAL